MNISTCCFENVCEYKDSIYGKRDGTLSGLLIVSKSEKYNIFKGTKAFKQGVTHGVQMLPRSSMWKPEVGMVTSCDSQISCDLWLLLVCSNFPRPCLAGPIFAAELTPPGQSSDRRAGNETGFVQIVYCCFISSVQ